MMPERKHLGAGPIAGTVPATGRTSASGASLRRIVGVWTCLVVSTTFSACAWTGGPNSGSCTLVGSTSGIQVTVPRPIRARLDTLSVELTQEGRARQVDFTSKR